MEPSTAASTPTEMPCEVTAAAVEAVGTDEAEDEAVGTDADGADVMGEDGMEVMVGIAVGVAVVDGGGVKPPYVQTPSVPRGI